MSLTDFLLARFAEDEAVAREAMNPTDFDEPVEDPQHGRWEVTGYGAESERCEVRGGNMIVYDEGGHYPGQARHIARHDPARVLADVEAKRRIVEKAQRANVAMDTSINPASAAGSFALTEVLQYLAAPYADHPDYQQEWKP